MLKSLATLAFALAALAAVSCGGGGDGGSGLDPELQALLERIVLTEEDLPAGLARASVSFSTNEDLAEAKGDPEAELEKLSRQGRRLGIDVSFLPTGAAPPDFVLRGGVQSTVSLYATADGASESFREGVEGVSQADLAAGHSDLREVMVEEVDRQIGDESVWFRITGIDDKGKLSVDDQLAFRVGAARGFLRAVSLFDGGTGLDAYLEEIAALAETAVGRIERELAAQSESWRLPESRQSGSPSGLRSAGYGCVDPDICNNV